MPVAATVAVLLAEGCATAPRSANTEAANARSWAGSSLCRATDGATCADERAAAHENAPIVAVCTDPHGCANRPSSVARAADVPVEPGAPYIEGHPLTSVVVTQCNLIVAVYMTMPDGRLLRFDARANVPAEELLGMAYTATRSERVEVSCGGDAGAVGYEKHDPV
jgi:hypothetical protein